MQDDRLSLEVSPDLRQAAPLALARAQYLYPDLTFDFDGAILRVGGESALSEAQLRKEILYLIYRESIRIEFAPFRRKVFERLWGAAP